MSDKDIAVGRNCEIPTQGEYSEWRERNPHADPDSSKTPAAEWKFRLFSHRQWLPRKTMGEGFGRVREDRNN